MPSGDIIALWIVTWSAIAYFAYKLYFWRRLALSSPKWLIDSGPDLVGLDLPHICVQIPLYNEPSHAAACIRACSQLDWPVDKLEIQVLNDSDDHTTELVEQEIRRIHVLIPDLTIVHQKRSERTGYKAGALNAGLERSDAPYVAIFDCDFRPHPQFLRQLMPSLLADEDVACVQARWAFNNDAFNFLTSLQAVLLNLHFRLEHLARSRCGLTFNFNGTAGIWRRPALDKLGGWSSQSVAEDLLISYRAQLAGWRLLYRDDVECISELPTTWSSFLVQQRRWSRGNGQVLRLLGQTIWQARQWSWIRRLDCLFHLSGYGVATLITGSFLFTPHWIVAKVAWIERSSFYEPARVFDFLSYVFLLGVILRLFASRRIQCERSMLARTTTAFALILIAPVLVLLIAPSFWAGLTEHGDKKSIFHRTPKGFDLQSLRPKDRCLVLLLTVISLFSTVLAFSLNSYVTGLILVAQLACWIYAFRGRPLNPVTKKWVHKHWNQSA